MQNDRKVAWKVVEAPIVLIIVAEFDSTGSVSTGVFQMLSAGKMLHVPAVGGCATDHAAKPSPRISPDSRIWEYSAPAARRCKVAGWPVSG